MRVVPDLRVTKLEQFETEDDPMWRVKSARDEQIWKQLLKFVTAALLLNSPVGMVVKDEQ